MTSNYSFQISAPANASQMENEALATQDLLKQCIREQCDEVEMLQSIFCNPGEMKITDHSILADMFDYLDAKIDHLNQKLDYSITIPINSMNHTLEIQFEFPHTYPAIEQPYLTVRTTLNAPNKQHIENEIKRQLYDYINSNEVDKTTVYVYPIVVWLQDNIDQLISSTTSAQKPAEDEINTDPAVEMERLWIYSHHLKSTTKRQDIIKLAKELDLCGFSKPGKPGIICVEGSKENTQEFWKIIRQWAWQRITVRLSEAKSKPQSKCQQFCRFKHFQEVLCNESERDSVAPMSMSEFMMFLENHNCGYVKKELFLLE